MSKLVERIKEEMKQKNLRKVDVARKAKVSRTTVTNLLAERFEPSPELLQKLSDGLGIPLDDLYRDVGYLPDSKERQQSAQEQRLLDLYDQLSDAGKELLEKQIKDVLIPFFAKKKLSNKKRHHEPA